MAANSKFCGNCGAHIQAGAPARKPKVAPGQLGCLVLLAAVAAVWWSYRNVDESNKAAALGPGMKVSVAEIARAWRANEVAAEQTYGHTALEITGTVTRVTTNMTSQAVVSLQTPVEGDDMRAFMADDARAQAGDMMPGQKITLHCGPAKALLSKPFVSECRLR